MSEQLRPLHADLTAADHQLRDSMVAYESVVVSCKTVAEPVEHLARLALVDAGLVDHDVGGQDRDAAGDGPGGPDQQETPQSRTDRTRQPTARSTNPGQDQQARPHLRSPPRWTTGC